MENIINADTYKGTYRKIGSYRRGKVREKVEDRVRRVGGITLSLLPNLASESSTARRGRGLWVRLTYPASGCWRLS